MYQMYHMFNKKRHDFNQCSNLRFLAPWNLWNLLQHRISFGRYKLTIRCAFGRAYPWPRECQNGKNEIEKISCEIANNRFSLHYSWKTQKPKTTEKIKSSWRTTNRVAHVRQEHPVNFVKDLGGFEILSWWFSSNSKWHMDENINNKKLAPLSVFIHHKNISRIPNIVTYSVI